MPLWRDFVTPPPYDPLVFALPRPSVCRSSAVSRRGERARLRGSVADGGEEIPREWIAVGGGDGLDPFPENPASLRNGFESYDA